MREKTILLVDDDQIDQLIVERAVLKTGLNLNLILANSGEEVLSGKFHNSVGSSASMPDLVLLDMNMPRMDGLAVLKACRARPQWSGIPILLYSTSFYDKLIKEAELAGAQDCLVKPMLFEDMVELLQSISAQWLEGHSGN